MILTKKVNNFFDKITYLESIIWPNGNDKNVLMWDYNWNKTKILKKYQGEVCTKNCNYLREVLKLAEETVNKKSCENSELVITVLNSYHLKKEKMENDLRNGGMDDFEIAKLQSLYVKKFKGLEYKMSQFRFYREYLSLLWELYIMNIEPCLKE